jgi:uncharacterized protein
MFDTGARMMNKITKFRWALITLAVLGIFGGLMHPANAQSSSQTNGPSFDCSKATSPIETTICGDPELVSLDRKMAQFYVLAHTDALGIGISNQSSAQRKWIKSRDSFCIRSKNINECIKSSYEGRLAELAVATLFVKPDIALPEIRHLYSQGFLAKLDRYAVPLYEAIFRYVTINDPTERTSVVEKIIAPIFDEIRDAPSAVNLLRDIPTAHDAVASDKNFATFLDVASVNEEYNLILPCAAIIRRPGLTEALGSKYGGAIDSHLPSSDCATTLPDLPQFNRLVKAAQKAQPFCQGTIRFSLGKEYEEALNAIRLHRADLWGDIMPDSSDDHDVNEFMAKHAPLIDAASTELFDYYTKEFKVEPELAQGQAEDQAEEAVDAAVSGAFSLCE